MMEMTFASEHLYENISYFLQETKTCISMAYSHAQLENGMWMEIIKIDLKKYILYEELS